MVLLDRDHTGRWHVLEAPTCRISGGRTPLQVVVVGGIVTAAFCTKQASQKA